MKRTLVLLFVGITCAIASPPVPYIPRASSDLSDAANIQLKNGTLAIASFGSITGVFPIANLPTGTTGSTVALGNHAHAASSLTGTTLASGVTASSLTSAAGGTFGTAAYQNSNQFMPASTVIPLGKSFVAHQFLTHYDPSTGNFGQAQPIFADLTSTPTTLSGYGITDAQSLDADLTALAALTTDSFGLQLLTKTSAANIRSYIGAGTSSFDGVFASLTSKPTTLSGYGITDAQGLDSDLTAIAGLTSAANKLPYFTGAGAAAVTDLSVFARTFLDDADAATVRATIGAGTSSFDGVFASLTSKPTTLSGYGITDAQGLDADLTAIAGLTSAANKLPYFTGAGAAAVTDLSAFARTFLDDADAATVRATIGAGTSSFDGVFASLTSKPTTLSGYGITDAQSLDSDLTSWASITRASGFDTFSATPTVANLKTLLSDETTVVGNLLSLANPAAISFVKIAADNSVSTRTPTQLVTDLSLTIGTNTQAWDADLDAIAALSSTGLAARTASNTWAQRSIAQSTGITVTNGDGVSGNPTVALAQMAANSIKGNNTGSTASAADLTVADVLAMLGVPVLIKTTSVAVLTAGTPADLTSLTIPANISRWHLAGTSAAATPSIVIAESSGFVGTTAGASFTLWDAAGGTGNQLSSAFAGPVTTTTGVPILHNSTAVVLTAHTIYFRQTANSANAANLSFYVWIWPL